MKKIKLIILLMILLSSTKGYAETEIVCNARYLYEIYHKPVPPAYHNSKTLGSVPIAGTGRNGYYEKVWSKTYNLKVNFFSGYEINNYTKKKNFNDNSIIAVVRWDNGNFSVITLENRKTNLKSITEDEIKFNYKGERNSSVTGYDNKGNYWKFFF